MIDFKPHLDKGWLYKTTRVVAKRGLIVSFRALVAAGKQQIEDKTPIYIADLQSMMTEDLRKKMPDCHDNDAGGVTYTVGRKVTRPGKPEASSGSEISPSNVSEQAERAEDVVNAGKRVKMERTLVNVSYLGEIR